MTSDQFTLLARLLYSKEPIISGVRLVLFEQLPNADAARLVGAHAQAVHRSTKRFMALHRDICKAYQGGVHERPVVDAMVEGKRNMQGKKL